MAVAGARGGVARSQAGGEDQQGGAQAFASGGVEVLADGGDGIDGCHGLGRQLALDLDQIVVDKVEDLLRCQGLPQLA